MLCGGGNMKLTRIKSGISRKVSYTRENCEKHPHMEIDGRREIIISGCTKIAEYSTEAVILRCFSTGVKVFGNELELVLLSGRVVAIRGKLSGMEFC